MKYRKLGRTGWDVSDVACGLWGMSGWSGSSDSESLGSLQQAADLGCNFFDTAWAYGEGNSDSLLGKIIAKNQGKRLYAASKIPPMNLKWPSSPQYKYTDVFPAEHVFQVRRPHPQEARHRVHRPAPIPRLGRQLDRRSRISRDHRKAEERKMGASFRIEPEPLGPGKRHSRLPHRTRGTQCK